MGHCLNTLNRAIIDTNFWSIEKAYESLSFPKLKILKKK